MNDFPRPRIPARTRRVASSRRILVCSLFVALAATALSACGETPQETPVTPMSDEALTVSVTYQSGDDVHVIVRGSEPRLAIEGASYPRFSPDGTRIAAVRGGEVVVAPVQGGQTRVLADGDDPHAVAWDPSGRQVFFTDGERILAVGANGGDVREVVRGYQVLELDAASDGRLVGTVKGFGYDIYLFDPQSNQASQLAAGCSASFSPDGALVSNLLDGHRSMELMAVRDNVQSRVLEAPDGIRYDNHMWTNHPDWIAGELEGSRRDIVLINTHDGRVRKVTDDGDASRGDVFIHGAD